MKIIKCFNYGNLVFEFTKIILEQKFNYIKIKNNIF